MSRAPRRSRPAGELSPGAPLDWARASGLGPDLAREIRREVARRRRIRFALAGAAAVLVLGFLIWQPRANHAAVAPTGAPTSAVVSLSEQRILPDGSILDLKRGSDLRVEYSATTRRVVLLGGEAHFQVKKDASWPFVVAAHDVEVRAVGTAFSVELSNTAVAVVVSEGRVAVESATPAVAATSPVAPALVDKGQRLTQEIAQPVDVAPQITPVSDAELARLLAWRVPRLEFSGTPLSEVVTLFERHGRVHLRLDDPALADVRVSGILRADNADALFRLLAADHGIVAERRGDGFVLARRP